CNEYMIDKTQAVIDLVKEVNSEEQLIDGIGLQSHLDEQYPTAKLYERSIKAYAETGLDLQITELDVTVRGNTEELFESQANYYKGIMSILLKYSDSISAVVFWGILDSSSWHRSNYPLLFNDNYTAKPSFYSIVELGNTTAGDDDYDDDKKQNYNILINASFEDNELNNFQPRGNVSVSIKTDGGKVGNNYLLVTRRSETWNGVQIPLNEICSSGNQYILSCFLKSRKQSQIILSLQYNDELDKVHYQNLKKIRTLKDWTELKGFRFIFPNDVTNAFIYFESNSPDDDIFVDEFVLKEIPEITIQTDIPSLKDVYDSFFKIGATVTFSQIIIKPTQRLILKHFNSITLENELKPSSLLDYKATI
ncbi:MAG: endo-1,4-beta-xylanase, partial [Bacilli bacterium]|nr:endo-1,4-beta-xylanase [Bacilli bacterium]